MTTKTIQQLTADDVKLVYSGRPGCACGCKGEYRYNSNMTLSEIIADRGYKIDDDENGKSINPRQVKRVLNLLQANERVTGGAEIEISKGHGDSAFLFWDETPTRTYTVYLMPGISVTPTPTITEAFAHAKTEKEAAQKFMNEFAGE